MKFYILALLSFGILQAAHAESFNFSVGDTFPVPRDSWVEVEERIMQQYRNGNHMLERGEECLIKYGGSVEILSFLPEGDRALVEYSAPSYPGGTMCPDGAVFAVSLKNLAKFEEVFIQITREKEEQKALEDKMMSRSDDLPNQSSGLSVGDRFLTEKGWVSIVEPIKKKYAYGYYNWGRGEGCFISGGSVQILSFSPEGGLALVKYLSLAKSETLVTMHYFLVSFDFSPLDWLTTSCPSGAVFVMSVEEMSKLTMCQSPYYLLK